MIKYSECTKQELIERIEALERFNKELLEEKEQDTTLDYAWTGSLGHWYWDVKSNTVSFNPLKITALGYTKEEIPDHVTYDFFTQRLHPQDYEHTMEAMHEHLIGTSNVYEVEYRIRTKDANYKWYYDRGKITQYSEEGEPLFVAGIVFDITDKKEIETELRQKTEQLRIMSYTDELTRIGNRRKLNEYLQYYISQSIRTNKPLSIAIFDVDNFKQVNDRYGHMYGDQVLVDIAQIIKDSIRNEDFIGRFGGEEFMVIFPYADLKEAHAIAEQVRKNVEEYTKRHEICSTVSAGVKQYSKEDISEFIDLADTNLYKAKKRGKNQIVAQ